MKRQRVREGYFSQEANSLKIHVSQLQIGMYVSKLDRPWLETPFLMQGFMVENLDDIDILAEYCEHVWVDSVQDTWIPPEDRAVVGKSPRKTTYINKVSAQDEHRQAMGIYKEARRITKSLLDDIRLGGTIDTEQAKSTVNDCVQSVIRNPDALIWMSKLREEKEYTAEHCLNVCILAIAFGRKLGLMEEELQNLGFCGLLHDVGKMKVPNSVLQKTSPLTDKEFNMIKAHTVHGRNLLMSSPNMYDGAIDVAYSHHERLDGKGYPRKLKASSITQFSRMIAIVDAYDAMTTDRCYAKAITSTDALKEIYSCRGTHFDEELSLAFIKTVGLYPPGSIVELDNGLVGLVLTVNHRHRHLPQIYAVLDQDKKPAKADIIDLKDVNDGKLSKDYLIKRVHCDGTFGICISDYREKGLSFSY